MLHPAEQQPAPEIQRCHECHESIEYDLRRCHTLSSSRKRRHSTRHRWNSLEQNQRTTCLPSKRSVRREVVCAPSIHMMDTQRRLSLRALCGTRRTCCHNRCICNRRLASGYTPVNVERLLVRQCLSVRCHSDPTLLNPV